MKRAVYSAFALTATLVIGQSRVYGQAPLGSEFTYQGQLKDAGLPADGDYDFVFQLFDAVTDGVQVGSDFPVNDWPISDGLFTVLVDFGDGAFNSEARWLEVAVRPWDSNDPHTVLTPRQPVTAAPVALYALDGPGSAGYWAGSGIDIYNTNSGNVGVGTAEPHHQLHVSGDFRTDARTAAGNDAYIGLGGGPYPDFDRIHDFSHVITDFSSSLVWSPVLSVSTLDPTVDLTNGEEIYGNSFETHIAEASDKNLGFVNALFGWALHNGTGQVTSLNGGYMASGLQGPGSVLYNHGLFVLSGGGWGSTGDITNNYGITVSTGIWGDGGSIQNNTGLLVRTPYAAYPIETHYGIYLQDQNVAQTTNYAIYSAGGDVYFNGDLEVTGTLSKGGGSFKIDHPLDPENKYLYHSFVESPDMMNIYNGNVVTDDDGRAWVRLPDYFEALNRDFRYQLTVLGQFAQAIVEREIEDGRFQIRTDKPRVKVSWQVTGIRKDPWAERNRIPVEEDKLPDDQGKYLHPELYGRPAEMGVHYQQPRPPMEHERGRAWQPVAP